MRMVDKTSIELDRSRPHDTVKLQSFRRCLVCGHEIEVPHDDL